jgi:membrane peptidoglycan carboxypeptidase
VAIAESMGVRKALGGHLDAVPSQVLGTNEVTPLMMAGAYAGFANHGMFCKPVAITGVTNRAGKALKVPDAACKQVVPREIADAVTSMLAGVIDGPLKGRTGQLMSLKRPAAGKTGTTNSSAAVWFAGFTPDLAAAVWCGDPRGGFGHPMKNVVINGNYYDQVFGSSLPGPIWKQAMLAALTGIPPTPWSLQPAQGLDVQAAPTQTATPSPGQPSPSASASPDKSPKPTTTSSPGPTPKPTSSSPKPKPTTSSPKPTTSSPKPPSGSPKPTST